MTQSQKKTIEVLRGVHGGIIETVELESGDVKIVVPPICPEYYKYESVIIGKRGSVSSSLSIEHNGKEHNTYRNY
jgi:alanine-alpha-ketoisovalerate/valine-pyruvate aminotransferase